MRTFIRTFSILGLFLTLAFGGCSCESDSKSRVIPDEPSGAGVDPPKATPLVVVKEHPTKPAESIAPAPSPPKPVAREIEGPTLNDILARANPKDPKDKPGCVYVVAKDTPVFLDPDGETWSKEKVNVAVFPVLGKKGKFVKSAQRVEDEKGVAADPYHQFRYIYLWANTVTPDWKKTMWFRKHRNYWAEGQVEMVPELCTVPEEAKTTTPEDTPDGGATGPPEL